MLEFEKDFFLEETRNGFYIEPMMKCAWAAELEVLDVIRQICEKHHITYFAAYGTLLGAIRHRGFIPWDDDIDIMMFREDYNRFLSVAPAELMDEYRLFTPHNHIAHEVVFAHLSNASTISYSAKRLMKFHGFPYAAGVDIMPLDTMPEDSGENNAFLQLFNIIIASSLEYKEQTEEILESLSNIEELCNTKIDRTGNIPHQLILLGDRISQCYNGSGSPYISSATYAHEEKERLLRDWFADYIWMPFENVQVPVPIGYERILTAQYGDYMTPINQKGSHDYPFYKNQANELDEIIARQIAKKNLP